MNKITKTISVLYVDDYKKDEEKILSSLGVNCRRVSKEKLISDVGFSSFLTDTPYQLRSARISVDEYSQIVKGAKSSSVELLTSNESFAVIADSEKQYEILKDFMPNTLFLNRDSTETAILDLINENQLTPPIFVRTDVESAAKYTGIDSCIIRESTIDDIGRVISSISSNIKGYEKIILKEMVNIAKDPKSGKNLEFRAIAISGELKLFDYEQSQFSISPQEVGIDAFAKTVIETLACGKANGGVFVDVAILENGNMTVIECKNLVNGTIRSIEGFGQQL